MRRYKILEYTKLFYTEYSAVDVVRRRYLSRIMIQVGERWYKQNSEPPGSGA
jgi:hypothetical protein